MLDLAWSEIALIAVVALVVIGPKDLPDAIKGVAKGIQSLRRKVAEFQQQADELVREAKLDDVRNQIADVRNTISDIRKFDIKGEIEKHVDGDGSVRKAFQDPMMGGSSYTPPAPYEPPPVPENAPAFVPPDVARWAAPLPPPAPLPEPVAAPAFVPPSEPAPVASSAPPAEPIAAPAAEPPPSPEPPRPAPTTPSV